MRFLLTLGLLAGLAAMAWWQFGDEVPRHWHPGKPLLVDDPLTPVSRWKLWRLADNRDGCLAALDTLPPGELRYSPLDDHEPVVGCPLENVVRVHGSGVNFNTSFVASCPLALAWMIFERQRLQPAAEELFGTSVESVVHYGSFACRHVSRGEEGRLSEHASAEALDVAAFHLADGRRITLRDHWHDAGPRGAFLRAVRDGACDLFGNVLGPDYDAAHADHFHFGMRGFRLCR